MKYDDEKPRTEVWGIADNHTALIVPGTSSSIIAALSKPKKMMVEFGCDASDPGDTTEFDLQGLPDTLAKLK